MKSKEQIQDSISRQNMDQWDIGYLFRESCYEKIKEISNDDRVFDGTYQEVDGVISPVKFLIEESVFENYEENKRNNNS